MQESYFEPVGVSELSGVKDCENIKWKRQMQYGHARGQSEPVSTY